MRKRSRARELALQILYQIDVRGGNYEDIVVSFWGCEAAGDADEEMKSFTTAIIKGIMDNFDDIDARIAACATNWQLKRMAVLDRNILRMGCYELIFRDDIPFKVSINEAVDLAKRYSGPEAGKFVNGILDKIKSETKK